MKKSIWEDSYNKLRKELKSIRKKAGFTQIQLAVKLDKPQSYISKYEIGDRNLDLIEIINVCKACDVKPESFVLRINEYLNKL